MTEDTYAVFGGTGFLGRRVVKYLLRDGFRVRIVARSPHSCTELSGQDRAEAVEADLLKPDSFEPALHGVCGVLNATSLYRETSDLTFEDFHCRAASRLAEAAQSAGVRRFLQISGIGADPNSSDAYIRARGRGEVQVRAAFPGAVIIRPSAMFGPDDALVSTIVETARRLPFFPLFGYGKTLLQPVHVEDVASACARLLPAEQVEDVYEFGGPRVLTYRRLVSNVTEAARLKTRPVPVPFSVWRLLAMASRVSPRVPLTSSQVALMEQDNVASKDLPGLPSLGIEPRDIADVAARLARQG